MEKERLEWRKDGEGKAGVEEGWRRKAGVEEGWRRKAGIEEGWRRKGWSRGRMEKESLE